MIDVVGTPIARDPFYHQKREKMLRNGYEAQLANIHGLIMQKEETIQDLVHQIELKDAKIEELKAKLKRLQSRTATLKMKLEATDD